MQLTETSLSGVWLIDAPLHGDGRGLFRELWRGDRYRFSGDELHFVQDNFSRSLCGTLRGLHYQLGAPQAKLVVPLTGTIYDVVVDLRRRSPTFGRWEGFELSAESGRQIFVPRGFAHGFYVLSESADVFYKCTDFYNRDQERTLLWNDPDLGIAWPLNVPPILSEKDRAGVPFAQAEVYEHD